MLKKVFILFQISVFSLLSLNSFAADSSCEDRYVNVIELGGSVKAVIAEGDQEPRSIGTYSVKVYNNLDFGEMSDGLIRPRDGFVADSRAQDVNNDGKPEIVVTIETAGSGDYTQKEVFSFDGKKLKLMKNDK
jgi:hypothetical protein